MQPHSPILFTLFGILSISAPVIAARHGGSSHVHPPRDTSTLCGENDLAHTDKFLLYNNLWGEDKASSGSQCTYLDYDSGNTISWHSEWSWDGGKGDVKSYPNAVLNLDATQLSFINELPTSFNWT